MKKDLDCLDKIFVYGALRAGTNFPYVSVLSKNRIYTKAAFIYGKLYNIDDKYPGIKLSESKNNIVHGEIQRFKNIDDVVRKIEEIDGYTPDKFRRKIVDANILFCAVSAEKSISVYVYEYNLNISNYKQILNGIW